MIKCQRGKSYKNLNMTSQVYWLLNYSFDTPLTIKMDTKYKENLYKT